MKKTKIAVLLLSVLSMLAGLFLSSCNPDDPEPAEARITEFAVINAGASADLRVEGVIEGLAILLVVPFETDVTALVVDVKISQGASVVPASGSSLDFSNPRNFVVSHGDISNTYQVTVQKADPTSPVLTAITVKSAVSGETYESQINVIDRQITVTLNNLQSSLVDISGVSVLPAGTTWQLSPLAGGDNLVDLDQSPVMTLSFAGEQSVYAFVSNVTEAGFNPGNTTTLMDKSGPLVPSVLNTNESRSAAFNGHYVVAPSRKEGNHVYYWDVNAGGDHSSLNLDGVSGGAWAVSDVQMVGEHIYVSNMVMAAEGIFKVYRWSSVNDSSAEVVLSYTVGAPVAPATAVRLGDALSIIGDPSADGKIVASNFPFNNPQNQFYIWHFVGGELVDAEPEIITVNPVEGARIGQYGRMNGIPGDSERFLVTGAEMGIAVVNAEGQVLVEVPDEVIQFRAYDPHVFEYNGGRYLSYTVNREWDAAGAFIEIVNITGASDIVEALQSLNESNIVERRVYKHIFGNQADAWISARNQVAFGTDGRPRVMGFTVLNGFVVKQLSN